MGKKNKKSDNCCGAQLNCEAVLAELIELRDLVERQSAAQEKAAKQLQALRKKLDNVKSCKCGKPKKKKKSKKDKKKSVVKPDDSVALFGLSSPENGTSDDLKMIAGIGPKLEETLNSLGIYHFHQIAAWQQAEIDWVDDHLMFTGRIQRENWIEQAQALAKGGRDEYVKVFGIEPR